MAYKDKDKQRQADKARQQRRRDAVKAKSVTNVTPKAENVTPEPEGVTELDPLPYGGVVLKDRALLESWARGEGSEYQRSLGILAMKYSQIHGVAWPGSQEIMDADTVYCRRVG